MAGPIQVVLNSDSFRVARETPQGGGSEDFFANHDKEFTEHKKEIRQQLKRAKEAIKSIPGVDVGYVKVTLRQSAWAKSHRPLRSLFKPERSQLVGGMGLGQMLFEVTSGALDEISRDVDQAELDTRMKQTKTGTTQPSPSRNRSEVGAIQTVEAFVQTDKRQFTIETALSWLKNPITGGGYRVELFVTPPANGQLDSLPVHRRRLWQSFLDGISTLGHGLTIEQINAAIPTRPTLSITLHDDQQDIVLRLGSAVPRRKPTEERRVDLTRGRHEQLLGFLDRHPLVRSIKLPPTIKKTTAQSRLVPDLFSVPERKEGSAYPLVGIIDGGISDVLKPWIRNRWGLLASQDRETNHGSFIGGLLVAGQALNGQEVVPEADGCDLVDIDIFPNDSDPQTFRKYFPNGVSGFLDELESAIRDCRQQFGTRIFNFSLNMTAPVSLDTYSTEAAKLDQIGEDTDSIITISAGNLNNSECRPEWAADPTVALGHLAASRNDALSVPAESIRNVSVSAINPPGIPDCVAHAPTNYSRRGPGLRTGVKPDFCHVGGAGVQKDPPDTGLFSISDSGEIASLCGTSFAAPLIAKTLAALDQSIEGNVTRETLIALTVHHATLPKPLQNPILSSVARHLVGFGSPALVDGILNGADHQATLVFSSRLFIHQQLKFEFAWPRSLVLDGGKCRGNISMTLVSSPPLNYTFDAEFVRVNLEAALQQYNDAEDCWKGRLKPSFLPPGTSTKGTYEAGLIDHGLKWSPIKIYRASLKGVGQSSNWRLVVDYLTRAGEVMPTTGVPFTIVLTIADSDRSNPVFNEVRQGLQAVGVQTADIRTAARVTPRV